MENTTETPALTPINLAAFIPKPAAAARTVEVEFKGVRFVVRHVNRTQLFMIGQSCTIIAFDPGTKSRTPRLDPAKLAKALANTLVAGWSKLTLRSLQNLMVLANVTEMTDEQLDTEIPFTPENLEMVLAHANGLDDFLQEIALDPANFRSLPTEEAAKN